MRIPIACEAAKVCTAFCLSLIVATPALVHAQASGNSNATPTHGPGSAARGQRETSATTDTKAWFTVAKGVTSEIFYPRLDVLNMQDMQYVITDGSFRRPRTRRRGRSISTPTETALE
jgi:glucoamylase